MLCIWIINSTLFSGTLSALPSRRTHIDIDICKSTSLPTSSSTRARGCACLGIRELSGKTLLF